MLNQPSQVTLVLTLMSPANFSSDTKFNSFSICLIFEIFEIFDKLIEMVQYVKKENSKFNYLSSLKKIQQVTYSD
jgi:hypothetical protein